jgi:hypothetical protein
MLFSRPFGSLTDLPREAEPLASNAKISMGKAWNRLRRDALEECGRACCFQPIRWSAAHKGLRLIRPKEGCE